MRLSERVGQKRNCSLPEIVEAIGTEALMERLQTFLQGVCGAGICAIHETKTGRVVRASRVIESAYAIGVGRTLARSIPWGKHPLGCSSDKWSDESTSSVRYERINPETLLIRVLWQTGSSPHILSIVSSRPTLGFRNEELSRLESQIPMLVSILAKHMELISRGKPVQKHPFHHWQKLRAV